MAININEFPLIAITELMDMDSGDASALGGRTVEDAMDYKRSHFEAEDLPSYKGDWKTLAWKQTHPVFIETGWVRPVLRNGHHRATKAHDVGMLFVHYTNDFHIGWSEDG